MDFEANLSKDYPFSIELEVVNSSANMNQEICIDGWLLGI